MYKKAKQIYSLCYYVLVSDKRKHVDGNTKENL